LRNSIVVLIGNGREILSAQHLLTPNQKIPAIPYRPHFWLPGGFRLAICVCAVNASLMAFRALGSNFRLVVRARKNETEDLTMRNQLRRILVFAVLTAFCFSGGTVLGQKQNKRSRQSRSAVASRRSTVWEYKITGWLSQEDINKLGAEGWELTAISAPNTDNVILYFKRPKR
jgi:hypothetical protein